MHFGSSLILSVFIAGTLLTPRVAAAECANVPVGPVHGKVSIFLGNGVVRTYRVCKGHQSFPVETHVWANGKKVATLKPPSEVGQCSCIDVSGSWVAVETSANGNSSYKGMIDVFYASVP